MSSEIDLKVRLAGIVNESVTDGPGLRITLFFQGCEHRCEGCHNPHTWSFQGGEEYSVDQLLKDLPDHPLIRGITLSGGDPFYQPLAAAMIAHEFHRRGKDVWTYTGFLWDDLFNEKDPARSELLAESDVLVDGPYDKTLRVPDLQFRGSSNQRLILVDESRQIGRVVEWRSSFDQENA
jgi:anaerobic ribonucleoside-triphosphate reductase activating protein